MRIGETENGNVSLVSEFPPFPALLELYLRLPESFDADTFQRLIASCPALRILDCE